MSIETDPESRSTGTPASAEPAEKLDFARYRTDELVDTLTDLISVPGRVVRIVKTAALVIVLTAVTCYLICEYSRLTMIAALMVSAYALVMSVYFGLSLGVLRVISKALQNIEAILQIVLKITEQVAHDYERVTLGKLQIPESEELIEQVYGKVLVPALERAVSRSFYFLARPILWCYRRSIGAALHKVVRLVHGTLAGSKSGGISPGDQGATTADSTTYLERVQFFTSRASSLAERLGRRLRTYAMLPIWVMYAVSLAIAAIPVVLTVYFL